MGSIPLETCQFHIACGMWYVVHIPQVGVLKGNLLVLIVIRSALHINNKMDENGVTWGIIDFFLVIINFDKIKDLYMEMRSME